MLLRCPKCSQGVSQSVRFCPHCGANFVLYVNCCANCGSAIIQGKRFCSHCGTAIGQVICVYCNRINQVQAKYCAYCGGPVNVKNSQYPFGTGKLPHGQLLGRRYLVIQKIAQGGMAAIYEVSDTKDNQKKLAVKEFSFSAIQTSTPAELQEVTSGFRREFNILQKLRHPNLISVYDYFEESSRQYYVMQLLEGKTLQDIVDSVPIGQFLPLDRVLRWARQLCEVFSFLHSQNPPIIYRDLKPSNVMSLAQTDNIILFDFGIARFYKPGQKGDTLKFGTSGYTPPETYSKGYQSSQMTDVYAMGVLLHQLLTKHDPTGSPFQFPSIHAINPSVPTNIEDAINRAMEKDFYKRTATMILLLNDLFGKSAEIIVQSNLPSIQPAGLAPAQKQISSVASPVGPLSIQVPLSSSIQPIIVFPAAVNFPPTGKGSFVAEHVQIKANSGSMGRVIVFQNWIIPDKLDLSPNDVLTINVNTDEMKMGDWELPQHSRIGELPYFVKNWLMAHIYQLVPGNGKYIGQILLDYGLAGSFYLPVSILIKPEPYRIFLGWSLVVLLIFLEIVFLLSPLALLFTL